MINTNIELNFLMNIAEVYYPKYISAYSHLDYTNSIEFKNLRQVIIANSLYIKKQEFNFDNIQSFKKTKDLNTPNWNDRCYSTALFRDEDNKINALVICISYVIPYFTLYNVTIDTHKNQFSDFKILPIGRDNEESNKCIAHVSQVTGFKYLANEFQDIIIEGISFEDIPAGEFTLFNAFFKNDKNFF